MHAGFALAVEQLNGLEKQHFYWKFVSVVGLTTHKCPALIIAARRQIWKTDGYNKRYCESMYSTSSFVAFTSRRWAQAWFSFQKAINTKILHFFEMQQNECLSRIIFDSFALRICSVIIIWSLVLLNETMFAISGTSSVSKKQFKRF